MADLMVKLIRFLDGEAPGESRGFALSLENLVRSYGATLHAPIPGLGEGDDYVQISGVPIENAEKLRGELERLQGVEAAYFKPSDELP